MKFILNYNKLGFSYYKIIFMIENVLIINLVYILTR